MSCFRPLQAWTHKEKKTENGKKLIIFNKIRNKNTDSYLEPVLLPCGQCIDCRLAYSKEWAIRCTHEMQLHDDNCFITLTYEDRFLPKNRTLVKDHLNKFIRRLRREIYPKTIRYFGCGEYGEETKRPHYHIIVFGFHPHDKSFLSISNGNTLYDSKLIRRCWRYGNISVSDANFQTAAYVARYVTKKVNNKTPSTDRHGRRFPSKAEHYGERIQEFSVMSRRPGIASQWIKKFPGSVYPDDFVVMQGNKKFKPPKYYDKKLELDNPKQYDKIKNDRKLKALENKDNQLDVIIERLDAKQKVQEAKASLLKRSI